MLYFTLFLGRSFWNLVYILHAQHISIWIGHVSSEQEPHVTRGYCIGQWGSRSDKIYCVGAEKGSSLPWSHSPSKEGEQSWGSLSKQDMGKRPLGWQLTSSLQTALLPVAPCLEKGTPTYLVTKRNTESFWTPVFPSFLRHNHSVSSGNSASYIFLEHVFSSPSPLLWPWFRTLYQNPTWIWSCHWLL